jgi:hypothetical protein
MGFFVSNAGSGEVCATLAGHCRLPDTHGRCENRVSRPGRVVLFLFPVRPSLQEGPRDGFKDRWPASSSVEVFQEAAVRAPV